jgi:molybdopterin/thiamine biosynthesis adenylyltransferase
MSSDLDRSTHVRCTHPSFVQALRLLVQPETHCVVARLSVQTRAAGCDWQIHEWSPRTEMPTGADWPGLADWVVLSFATPEIPSSDALLEAVQPGPWQRVVALVLARDGGEELTATLCDHGQPRSPTSLEISGAHRTNWTSERPLTDIRTLNSDLPSDIPPPHTATPPTLRRHSRTKPALPVPLESLASSHVALVGVGRLGELLAQSLAPLVGRQTLIDPDRVGEENLDGMPALSQHDVGQAKVTAVAKRLVENRSALMVTAVPEELRSPVCQRLFHERRFDLIVTCVDERGTSARLKATDWARQHLVPHLDVGALIERDENGQRRLKGDVRLFEPGVPGCVACCPALPAEELRRAEVELAGPVGSLPPGPHLDWSTHRLGSLFHWNAVICGVAIETYLRFLSGEINSSIWTRLIWDSGRPVPSLHSQVFDAIAGCRRCRLPPAADSPGS